MTDEQLVTTIGNRMSAAHLALQPLLSDAHFPKCRHRPDPAAWSGDLCEEPVTFRDGGAGVSLLWHLLSAGDPITNIIGASRTG